ncbi:hypothetical protein RCO48_34795 [Peribacillus frigoritolerans]|nr:hypothetical protein [Peribacillus frigoritolerans]
MEGARLLREKRVSGETPQAQGRRGRTARGKRVPGVEINVKVCTSQKKCRQPRFTSKLSTV